MASVSTAPGTVSSHPSREHEMSEASRGVVVLPVAMSILERGAQVTLPMTVL